MPQQRTIKYFENFAAIKSKGEIITALASSDAIDRDGEVICHGAFSDSLDSFVKNGTILACHQHRLADGTPPMIGRPLTAKYTNDGLEVQFKLGQGELAQKWRVAREDGTWRGVSVGFIPVKGENRTIKDTNIPAYHHTKAELLELSAVPVGSNRDATLRSYQDNEFIDLIKNLLTDGFSQSRKELLEELKVYIESLIVPENETLTYIMDSSSDGDNNDKQVIKTLREYVNGRQFISRSKED